MARLPEGRKRQRAIAENGETPVEQVERLPTDRRRPRSRFADPGDSAPQIQVRLEEARCKYFVGAHGVFERRGRQPAEASKRARAKPCVQL